MSNTTHEKEIADIVQSINNPKRSPWFWLTRKWYETTNDYDKPLCYTPFHEVLSEDERKMLVTMTIRRSKKLQWETTARRHRTEYEAKRFFYLTCSGRKYIRHALLHEGCGKLNWNDLWHEFFQFKDKDMVFSSPLRDVQRSMGQFLKKKADFIWRSVYNDKSVRRDIASKLALYDCSGELEFRSMNRIKQGLGRRSFDFWDVGHDGGGQHEVRFLIKHKLPELACSMVGRIGGTTGNGGHIHINCKRDEAVAERVYDALRYHLSWFRFLCPKSRREGRWASVEHTPRLFCNSLRNKYTAVSASSFVDFGTIEVRLWPSTSRASDWHNRAELMRQIALWSEFNMDKLYPQDNTPSTQTRFPITRATAPIAFMQFANWLISSNPSLLVWLVKQFKSKSRENSRDHDALVVYRNLLSLLDQEGIKILRSGRVIRVQPPQPAASNEVAAAVESVLNS